MNTILNDFLQQNLYCISHPHKFIIKCEIVSIRVCQNSVIVAGFVPGYMLKLSIMDVEEITQFQNDLLGWYDKSARILPWRDNPSPYRVWVSEIMLQQTRVDTVKPYFEKFMSEIPTLEALADISEDKLLKLWEGLGYYSRARNLKKAATMIIEKYNNEMPPDMKALKSLPGIGPYSAGAIASIAFGMRAPAIDGNVLRVIARVTANRGDIAHPAVKKEIGDLVEQLLPKTRVGAFNQALMELGAIICLPNGTPKCTQCPVQTICLGNQQGIAVDLPVKAKKMARKIEERTVFIIISEEKTALRQRSEEGLLANLWEFPNVNGHLSFEESHEVLEKWNIPVIQIIPLKAAKHIFTHLEWHMQGYLVLTDERRESSGFTWATQQEIKHQYSIPSAFKNYLKCLDECFSKKAP